MDHLTMFEFKKQLLKEGGKDEERVQATKKFCDGTMQKYLLKRWDELHQSSSTTHITGA